MIGVTRVPTMTLERFSLAVSTLQASVAGLRRVRGVDQCERPTGAFSLVGRELDQLVPRGVMDAFREVSVYHFGDVQVLETERPEVPHQAVREFVGEVLALVRRLFVGQRDSLAPETTFGRALILLAEPALHLGKRLFGLLEEAGVFDGLARGKRGKLGQAHVHADHLGVGRQGRCLDLASEAGEPFTSGRALDGEGLGRAFDVAVQDDLDAPDLRHVQLAVVGQFEARAGERERVIAEAATEAREAGSIARLAATEEGFHRQIHAHTDVLERLRVRRFEKVMLGLPAGKHVDRVIEAQAHLLALPCGLAGLKHLIVDPPASAQTTLQERFLSLGRVDSVLEGLFMHMPIIPPRSITQTNALVGRMAAHAAWLISPRMNPGVLRHVR